MPIGNFTVLSGLHILLVVEILVCMYVCTYTHTLHTYVRETSFFSVFLSFFPGKATISRFL